MKDGRIKAIVQLPKGVEISNAKDAAKWFLDQLSAEERYDLLSNYCNWCGRDQNIDRCYCDKEFWEGMER